MVDADQKKVNNIENPLVSIIVITYNSERHVLETLESANNQTYSNIELVISDDCSKDATIEKCYAWIKKHGNRFRRTEIITNSQNSGIPANCNRGVKAARGEWIKLIAGDDMLLENCIEANITYTLNQPEIGVLLSLTKKFLNSVGPEKQYNEEVPAYDDDFYGKNIKASEQYELLLISDRVRTTPTAFIRKSTIEEVGYYDERFKLVEDYPMWLKLTKTGHKLYFMDKVTVCHRIHETSVNNFVSRKLIKPSYFTNEEVRKALVYPNIHPIEVCRRKTVYCYSRFFVLFGMNRKGKINIFIFKVLTRILNPFSFFSIIRRSKYRHYNY